MKGLLTEKSPRGTWIVGHRGAMGTAPENTMASFHRAARLGADWVECDVHLSRDGRCVVIHDEKLDRTAGGSGRVKDASAARIRKLDAGAWFHPKFAGEKVPFLDELLRWAKKQKGGLGLPLGVVVEIKSERIRYPGIAERVVKAVQEAGMRERVVLISFNHQTVRLAKKADPGIAAGILYSEPLRDAVDRALAVRADALFPRRTLVTKALVEAAHRAGLAVAAWTVNEPADIKKCIRSGADAITTNFPERLLDYIT